jgi:hypothetical protein
MCTLRRTAGLLATVALALTMPAAAHAGASHPLKLYKVERHVDLEGDGSYTVSCTGSDYAMDGMWRVDNVDQDSDIPGNIKTQVAVYGAYPDASDKSEYHFSLENLAGGDAQVKLFVTCLGKDTDATNGHTVSWVLGARNTDPHASGPGLGGGFMPADCAVGEIAVAPGFRFLNDTIGHIVASRTSLPGDGPAVGRNWSMVFVLDYAAQWETYTRCLRLKSNPGPGGHAHRIVVNRVGGNSGVLTPINPTWEVERQSSCGEQYKGLIHGFDTSMASAPYLWFFGMDPRIKTRAYRFYNADPVNPVGVWTGLTCFKDRTT